MANKRSPGLSPIVLRKKFGAGMTTRNYRDQEVVFSQGDTADAVFYIQSGTVKLTSLRVARKHNRLPAARQLFRRRQSRRATSADLPGAINCAIQYHSLAKGEHGSRAQARPAICSAVC